LKLAVRSAVRWYKPDAWGESYFSPSRAGREEWKYLEEEGVKVYVMCGGRDLFVDEIRGMVGVIKGAGVDVRLREVSCCSPFCDVEESSRLMAML